MQTTCSGALLSGRKWRVPAARAGSPPLALALLGPGQAPVTRGGRPGDGAGGLAGPRAGPHVGEPLAPRPLPSDCLTLLPRFLLPLHPLYHPTCLSASL